MSSINKNKLHLKKDLSHDEFPSGASEFTDPKSRRTFLKLMGASMAFAGLTGCDSIRRPVQTIRPYAKRPETVLPGKATYYATSMSIQDDVIGLVVASHEGRPTKIEGNPLHPNSLGATNAQHQASILDLYDPDRLKVPTFKGRPSSWSSFSESYKLIDAQLKHDDGYGLVVVADKQPSPTFYRLLSRLKQRYPKALLTTYSPVNSDNQMMGLKAVTGHVLQPQYDFSKPNVLLSFGHDFMGVESNSIPHSRDFVSRRNPSKLMNRLYVVESDFSITGAQADHRVRLKSSSTEIFMASVLANLLKQGFLQNKISSTWNRLIQKLASRASHAGIDLQFVDAVVKDLLSNQQSSLVLVGSLQSSLSHSLGYLINRVMGNLGQSVTYTKANFSNFKFNRQTDFDNISQVVDRLNTGKVKALVLLGADPVFTAPVDLNFSDSIKKASTIITLSSRSNKSVSISDWALPQSHFLESWGDLQSTSGVVSVVQPLISPMYDSKSNIEFLSLISGLSSNGYRQVRRTWRIKGSDFDSNWRSWLHNGIISPELSPIVLTQLKDYGFSKNVRDAIAAGNNYNTDHIELVFKPDYSLFDGRFSNNGWLQELPDPVTKLTWDNAAYVSPKTAQLLGVSLGNMIIIDNNGSKLEVVVFVLPGMADYSIILPFGYGQSVNGRIGRNVGFNSYSIFRNGDYVKPNVTIIQSFKSYPLSSTQDQMSIEGRPLIQSASLSKYKKDPTFAKKAEEVPHTHSSWDEVKYDKGYQWGMTIDLSKCTGCNACVIGCQSENNIPIVGKDEVAMGREMHWIRVDRYFDGEDDNVSLKQQPVTCLQCENAPCEQVCPVAATVHSEEGTNDMVYNRCVGTRYCLDNCPTKVRRFNFFDYHQRNPQSVKKDRKHLFDYLKEPAKTTQMQFNPDVTVRMRGVMEKCTYCIQRINKTKSVAANENRLVTDGEIQTACQQVCPTQAISFGNIIDKTSVVYKERNKQLNYQILKGLHLKARTTYGAIVTNPNPSLVKTSVKEAANGH